MRAQNMAECSGFAAIVCLGIRLGPVSFHGGDDNNGCNCRDDCWHHYSCVLPHASIFTCCTDAPEVNEFFTLEFRAGSHRHIASHMRGAQQVNQRTSTTHFSFLSRFSLQYHITWLCLILPLGRLISLLYMFLRNASDPKCMMYDAIKFNDVLGSRCSIFKGNMRKNC